MKPPEYSTSRWLPARTSSHSGCNRAAISPAGWPLSYVTRIFASFLIISAGLVFAGASAKTPPNSVVRSGTDASAQSAAAIESAIKAKLARSKIGADHFKVHVQGG